MTRPAERHDEIVNVYDGAGRVVGTSARREAKQRGLTLGAVHALVVNRDGQVLLQQRPARKENGTRWDKSVGGHVSAGESFDETVVREAGEELFDDPDTTRVILAGSADAFARLVEAGETQQSVVLFSAGVHHGLRDVRVLPGDGFRNASYHVGIYLGRTDLPEEAFRPQPSEIDALRYHAPAEVDRLLLAGRLAPNMAFLWLGYGRALLDLVPALSR